MSAGRYELRSVPKDPIAMMVFGVLLIVLAALEIVPQLNTSHVLMGAGALATGIGLLATRRWQRKIRGPLAGDGDSPDGGSKG